MHSAPPLGPASAPGVPARPLPLPLLLAIGLLTALLSLPGRSARAAEPAPPPRAAAAQPDAAAQPAAPTREAAPDEGVPGERDPADRASTIGGLSGLVRVVSAGLGMTHTFRLGLHTELLQRSGFLVAGDRHVRLVGTLSLAYTPWRHLELFANLRSQANHNQRADSGDRRDPAVIFALGDLTLGGKVELPLQPYFAVGGQLELNLLNAVGGVFYKGAATGFYLGTLTSLHLDALRYAIPARLHANLGFRLDRSDNLRSFAPNYDLASLQVEKFALGINRSRLQLKLGAEGLLGRWTRIDLRPLLEWGLDLGTGSADGSFAGRVPAGEFGGRVASWLTVGARVRPLRGLSLTVASDLGITSPGFGYGPPVPVWNLIAGLGFAYDPLLPLRQRSQGPCTPTSIPVAAARATDPALGRIQGKVVHADTLRPIEGVVVGFPGRDLTNLSTGADGSFLSPALPPGIAPVLFRHHAYVATQTRVTVAAGATAKLHVMLQPALPQPVAFAARITDPDGKPLAAFVELKGLKESATPIALPCDAAGAVATELQPGDYTLSVTAPGYVRVQRALRLNPGAPQQLILALERGAVLKPVAAASRDLVQLTANALLLRRKIHFSSGKASPRGDALRMLDVVADVLLANPQLTHVEIQGHTDSNGPAAANQRLSQARADAIREHLIQRGVAAERLTARGYGAERPTQPNLSAQNREANRRVEFHLK
ncbi:MAG: OmpA family protein [Proteobacteria bacterium]|nr:OmpA family protein [Pseudomonadota bacterium]